MKQLAACQRGEVHRLACAYHWSESAILRLSRRRRREYLSLIDAESDAGLFDTLRGLGSTQSS
ncbi:MAG TPA: hypothetical protein VM869_03460 [Enhygromyxa sp.]|nr:hypothetical protein [Enhygromyxa sp.]